MAHIPNNMIRRRIINVKERYRQLHDTQIRAEVSSRARHVVNQEGADLRRQLIELSPLEATQLTRGGTARQQVTRRRCSRHGF